MQSYEKINFILKTTFPAEYQKHTAKVLIDISVEMPKLTKMPVFGRCEFQKCRKKMLLSKVFCLTQRHCKRKLWYTVKIAQNCG